ncbi:MAG: pyridoxal 5'-phosphate synthase glutaminase subunit PdxT [Eubacterium aggregans]|uniref:pyridoxal 5'-phosphate synthase glutaminase subunit PdxT n=1 Tax=Eubacterium aggregans TaxID=81409 RepID=UPI000B7CC1FB|nr:pyridoxal 5'-phosphate synthase glutaminase subunit PdxT [Eubacterium aggregans]MEA5073881.1 pyridoxal 5'-phosphate synthase glutaminase subunit PdxT [Eubacterium aggregans]
MAIVGVLSLQGAVTEHLDALRACGAEARPVKTALGFEGLSGLILPGGESTTMAKLLRDFHLMAPLKEKIQGGLPVWGTCAGLILLARKIEGEASHLGVMDMAVRRNAYGTQLDSFTTQTTIEEVSPSPIPLAFIRAPYIKSVGPQVTVLSRVDGHIVAARQGFKLLATAFHPEVTGDERFHQYFIRNFCGI